MTGMILYQQAIDIIQAQGKQSSLSSESVPLSNICGRVLAENIVSSMAYQPFDNSSMDGFAARACDVEVIDKQVELAVIGQIVAGDAPLSTGYQPGTCYEIMTGAPIPTGYDAVVPVEKVIRKDASTAVFSASVAPGDFIRRAGADFKKDDVVLTAGTVLQATHILTLATLGIQRLNVLRPPRVAVISTGLEIVDDLSATLNSGQIYNATRPYLQQALPALGCDVVSAVTVADDAVVFREKLENAQRSACDLVISTGAVSAGVHDFIPGVLKEAGAEIFFHKVAIRPGRPVIVARLPKTGTFFIGLPGNPASTAVGVRFFIEPLLRILRGQAPEQPKKAVLSHDFIIRQSVDLRLFLRANVSFLSAQGFANIEILPGQQSFMVRPFVLSNAWAVLPEKSGSLPKGAIIDFYD